MAPVEVRLVIQRLARPPFLAAAVAATLLLAACDAASASPTTASPSPVGTPGLPGLPSGSPSAIPSGVPDGPSLLLQVASEGGFINPSATIATLPAIVVDTDGRIFTPAVPADGSSPMIPPLEVRDTGPAGAAAILQAIRAAGLGTGSSGGMAADAGSTVFTAVIDGNTVVSRFAAGRPGGVGGGAGGPGAPTASTGVGDPGAAAFALLARLVDPAETWGHTTAPEPRPFRPDGYLVFVAPSRDATTGAPAWPLATAAAAFGSPSAVDRGVAGLRAGLVIGSDAGLLASRLARVQAGTVLASGGHGWSVWVRPLYPDELGT